MKFRVRGTWSEVFVFDEVIEAEDESDALLRIDERFNGGHLYGRPSGTDDFDVDYIDEIAPPASAR